ncbi:hypothetical protein [Psychroserpens sp. Hel_I_66]|nr:hypothetical protein [Psychroserpens sp. Hel_I_66]
MKDNSDISQELLETVELTIIIPCLNKAKRLNEDPEFRTQVEDIKS